ncbi:MAG: hypothetical protein AAB458_00365 [Patescibacteria group bacterium]
MQDIFSSEKRSIRNISIDRPQTTSGSDIGASSPQVPPQENGGGPNNFTPFSPRRAQTKRKWVRIGIWVGVGAIALVILFLIVGSFFEGARVAIGARHALVNLNDTGTVGLTGENIPYEIVEVSKEESKEVAATGEDRIERAATGVIVIYNDFDTSSQKLIKNTRFETPDGKIFRIRDSVTVPGQTKGADGKRVPGSVEAEVFADSPGEEYNIGLSDFTIPGFKESKDPRFDKFYARSKTTMTGGFIGTVRTADKNVTASAQTELKELLEAGGAISLSSDLPAGFIILPETVAVAFEDLPNTDGATEATVNIRMKSVTRGIAIDGNALARSIADDRIASYEGEGVRLENTGTLSITLPKPVTVTDIPATFEIRVAGPANIIWTYDAEELKMDLAGVRRTMTDAVFVEYPAIENADIAIQPFWSRSLPDDPETIEIVDATNE